MEICMKEQIFLWKVLKIIKKSDQMRLCGGKEVGEDVGRMKERIKYWYICIVIVEVGFRQFRFQKILQEMVIHQLPLIAEVQGILKENSSVQKGFHQAIDLKVIIHHIRLKFCQKSDIILWGRSMGAVAIMRYLTKYETYDISLAILDSPFINLSQVICQTMKNRVGTPKILVDMFLNYLQPKIQEKVSFKISQFDLRKDIKQIQCPLILMASKSDGVVPFSHLEQIYNLHQGRKTIFYLKQTHIQQRSEQTITKVFKAIERYCKVDGKIMLKQERNSIIGLKRTKSPNPSENNLFKTPQNLCKNVGQNHIYSHRVSENYQLSNPIQKTPIRKKLSLVCSSKSLGRMSLYKNQKNSTERPIIDIGNSKKKAYNVSNLVLTSDETFSTKKCEQDSMKLSVFNAEEIPQEETFLNLNNIKSIQIKKPQSTPASSIPCLSSKLLYSVKDTPLITQMVIDHFSSRQKEDDYEVLDNPFTDRDIHQVTETVQSTKFSQISKNNPHKIIRLVGSPQAKQTNLNKKSEQAKTTITLTKKHKTESQINTFLNKQNSLIKNPVHRKLSINQIPRKKLNASMTKRQIKILTTKTSFKNPKTNKIGQEIQEKLNC